MATLDRYDRRVLDRLLRILVKFAEVRDDQIPIMEAQHKKLGVPLGTLTEQVAISRAYKAGMLATEQALRQTVALMVANKPPQA